MLTRPGVTTRAAEIDALVGLRLLARADRGDEAVLDEDPAVRELGAGVVHRDDVGVREQGRHRGGPYLCRVDVLTPRTLDEALRLKAEHPDARPIAGGTDLLVELNFDRTRPEAILNLTEVPELRGWSRGERRAAARRRPDLHRGDAAAARRAAARARRGLAHRRLAADPQPRHDRRQPRHRLAGRRCAAAAARRGGRGRARRACAAPARCR